MGRCGDRQIREMKVGKDYHTLAWWLVEISACRTRCASHSRVIE